MRFNRIDKLIFPIKNITCSKKVYLGLRLQDKPLTSFRADLGFVVPLAVEGLAGAAPPDFVPLGGELFLCRSKITCNLFIL